MLLGEEYDKHNLTNNIHVVSATSLRNEVLAIEEHNANVTKSCQVVEINKRF